MEGERNGLAFKVSILTERLEETKAELVARYEASAIPTADAEEGSVARAVGSEKEKEYQLAERCHAAGKAVMTQCREHGGETASYCWAPQASM